MIKTGAYSNKVNSLHTEGKYRSMVGAMDRTSREKLYGIKPVKSVVDRTSLEVSAKHYFQDPKWRELSAELQNLDFKCKGTPLFLPFDQVINCLEAGVCIDNGDGKILFTNQYTAAGMNCMTCFEFCFQDQPVMAVQNSTLTIEQGDLFQETTMGAFINVTKYPIILKRYAVDKTKKFRELVEYVPDIPMP